MESETNIKHGNDLICGIFVIVGKFFLFNLEIFELC